MMTMKINTLLFAAFASCVFIAGCAKSEDSASGTPATAPGATPPPPTSATSIPKDGVPPGGIVLQPKNPNDPHFQPDPKLKGGG
jgi:nitrous oxide reductase accessory protein NosL